jgi:hypothetical protein
MVFPPFEEYGGVEVFLAFLLTSARVALHKGNPLPPTRDALASLEPLVKISTHFRVLLKAQAQNHPEEIPELIRILTTVSCTTPDVAGDVVTALTNARHNIRRRQKRRKEV